MLVGLGCGMLVYCGLALVGLSSIWGRSSVTDGERGDAHRAGRLFRAGDG